MEEKKHAPEADPDQPAGKTEKAGSLSQNSPISTVKLKLNLTKGRRVRVIIESLSGNNQGRALAQIDFPTKGGESAKFGLENSPGSITATISPDQINILKFDPPDTKYLGYRFSLSITRIGLILLGIGIIAVGLWMKVGTIRVTTSQTWIAILAGLSLILAGLRPGDPSLSIKPNKIEQILCTWLGVKSWQLDALIAGIALSLLAWLSAGYSLKMILPWIAVAGWIGGMACVLLGGWPSALKPIRVPRSELMLIAGLIVAAFFFRAINTTNIPIILHGDESSAGLSAIEFIKGNVNNIFRSGWFSFPSLFSFWQSLSIRLMGNTIPALRIPSALVGAVTVGALYLMGKAMFGKWAGLYAAIFLVAFGYHIHFSRIGLNNIWDGFWYVFVLGCLWYGWHAERREYLLLSGLGLGLSQYFYISARALWLLIPAWILLVSVQDRSRFKRLLPGLLLTMIVAVVAVFPLAMFFWNFPNEFLAPMARVSILGRWMTNTVLQSGLQPWQILLRQISLSLGAFTSTPLRSFFFDPQTPLLRPFPAALFLVGGFFLVIRLRDTRAILLILWMSVFVVSGALSDYTPAAQRYVAVAPALALVLGFAIAELVRFLGRFGAKSLKIFSTLGLVIILILSVDELLFYFYTFTPFSTLGGSTGKAAMHLAEYLQSKDNNWEVLFFGSPEMNYRSIDSISYLAPQVEGTDIVLPWGATANPVPNRKNVIFVFLPNHQTDLEKVQSNYPGGKLLEERTWSHELLYWLYEVEAINNGQSGASP